MKVNFSLGESKAAFERALQRAEADNVVARIWERDHTVWSPDPDEISNRLGWLDIADRMQCEVGRLEDFARKVREAGIRHVLLMGMGGSSLAPEVFSRMMGASKGYPSLDVLDSTDPAAVRERMAQFKPQETLYVVSTKSGGTVETISFFKTFYNQAREALGEADVGQHFVAITDPGSKLEALAKDFGFGEIFISDPNIGGRYSALSYFGLVPAALLGIDLDRLLAGAIHMAKACGAERPAGENSGAQLGLAMAELAKAGRDKLTFVTAEALAPFGDWAEQLIAESTGKSGTGILPVVGEPRMAAEAYGTDRVFVGLWIDDADPDLADVTEAGQPVIRIDWEDIYDLGAQFFVWEFATAVAGYGMGIQPFNQPNVEAAKVQARKMTEAYIQSGILPEADTAGLGAETLLAFVDQAQAGDYLAIQAYVQPSGENEAALQGLRSALLARSGLATTLGFGPRFLHSTGQLHKGDGGNGLFIQLISPPPSEDLVIPLEAGASRSEISFGVLKQAQALGDAQALREAGRRVISMIVDRDVAAQVLELTAGIRAVDASDA
ncbi:MAG: glucose-6-phosphate isomerase [Chloroflexi bacterium]|nr:glucose-6-phosphate isomerase [Chloroflexota bacterium]MQC26726.1 glucose-6-phosphate isomerase [Chloroflexota bacterium]